MRSSPTPSASPATTGHNTHEIARREIAMQIEMCERMAPAMRAVDEVADKFPELKPRTIPVLSTGSTILSLTVLDLKQMVPVARAVTMRGFHIQNFEDDSEQQHRRYFYENKSGLSLQVFASLDREHAVCHFKKVGVKE